MTEPTEPSSFSTQLSSGIATAAVVMLVRGRSELRVAGLTVLDRLLVALHRAGFESITVVRDGEWPPVERATRLGIQPTVVSEVPQVSGPTLWVRAELLLQAPDLKRLRLSGGRLVSATGDLFPVGILGGDCDPWRESFDGLGEVRTEGVACWVRNPTEAIEASRVLWQSLTSSSDGWVDRVFNRPVGRPLSRWLSRTPVTPNQISWASILLGVVAGVLFGLGDSRWAVAAAVLFQVSAVLDCVDGDVARIVFKESPMGKWLDLVGDQVVHLSVFAGIAVGLERAGTQAPVVWLGAAAMAGAILSFALVLRGMRRIQRGIDNGVLGRFLDAATNRDFSVLVFVLACVGWLEVFLWLAAVGSHVFWGLLWWMQSRSAVGTRGDS